MLRGGVSSRLIVRFARRRTFFLFQEETIMKKYLSALASLPMTLCH